MSKFHLMQTLYFHYINELSVCVFMYFLLDSVLTFIVPFLVDRIKQKIIYTNECNVMAIENVSKATFSAKES